MKVFTSMSVESMFEDVHLTWRCGPKGSRTWSSLEWSGYTGLTDAQSNGEGWLDAVHPDDRASVRKALAGLRPDQPLSLGFRLRDEAEQIYRTFRTWAIPMNQGDNRPPEWFGISKDIETVARLQEDAKTLRAELQHRVRNALALTRSIARRTAQNVDSVEDFSNHLEGRLEALARTQNYILSDPARGVDLELLVLDEMQAHMLGANDRIDIDGEEVALPTRIAASLGLAIHELAVNALKFGALADDGGKLEIIWSLERVAGQRRLKLLWREGFVTQHAERPGRPGFGTELLQRTLPYEIGAVVKLDVNRGGLTYSLEVPL